MPTVNGGKQFGISVGSGAFVQIDPYTNGYTGKPLAAAVSLHLHNGSDVNIAIVNNKHAAYPPAATYAAAQACLCLVKILFPGADLQIEAPVGGFPDTIDLRDYSAIAEASGAILVVDPQN